MRLISLFFISFSLLLSCSDAYAQPRGFSNDPQKFISEMEAYFRDTKAEDEARKTLSEFKKIYDGGFYSEEQQKIILNTANQMAVKRMRANSEYKDYLQTLIDITKTKSNHFDYVHEVLYKLLLKKNRDANTFLSFCSEFFDGNKLYLSKSVHWFIEGDSFKMEFDSIPKIIIPKTTITGLSRGDRIAIYNTEGVYFPLKNQWVSKGGTVNWARAGLDSTIVYAELSNYTIDCSKSDYKAEKVKFYHKQLFKSMLLGSFEDRMSTNYKAETATYPKFDSYEKKYEIKNFFKNVDYYGGFAMSGSKLYGTGNEERKASITIYARDTVALKTYSTAFVLQANEIVSYPSEVSIYLDKDSIYHPGVEFRFNAAKRKLVLLRRDAGIGNASFFDSYHQMSYEVERIEWNIDELRMELGMIRGRFQRESYFESKDFYKEEKFRKVAGIMDINPLTILKRLSIEQSSHTVSIASYANAVRLREHDVIGLLRNLVELGFIGLNEERGTLFIKEKTFNYISNEAGNLDYDVLRFASLADSNINATLDLKTKELEIVGIENIFLSDSQSVYIKPLYGKVKVLNNRNIVFGGKVHGGTLDFYGRNFYFNYKTFQIEMPKIDSLKIKVLGKQDINGNRELLNLKTVLKDINGTLYIDGSDNKSGLKNYPHYPYFEATNESYVYYDYPYIQNSAYRRADFYFKIEPFVIDSLDDLNSTSGLAFPGLMYSGGIFPDFKETLTFQPDTSLGFVHRTPENGYPIYKGKGTYYSQIKLSDRGFFGDGRLEYIASTTISNNFLFLLDSLNAPINTFDIPETVSNPVLASRESFMHWMPYADSMFVTSKKSATNLYAGKNLFLGTVCYTPSDLSGDGLSKIKGADIRSTYFVFSPNDFNADTSFARIYALDTTKMAIEAGNMKSKIDFIASKADFKLNDENTMLRFPANYYATTLPEFTWYFKEQYMDFKAQAGKDTTAYSFVSIHPLQDSLNFNAIRATYDLNKLNIEIEGVPRIFVADAEIIPDSAYVEIYGEAIMRRLENAVIYANTNTRYHKLYDSKVDVLGRKKYNANAFYDYRTQSDTGVQKIHFAEIKVDTTLQTFAKGSIVQNDKFMLNAKLRYKGDVYLHAAERFLSYDGFVKVNHNSQFVQSQYFRYQGFVNPDTVALALINPRDTFKAVLFSGIHINNMNFEGYSSFIGKKIEPNDHDVIRVEGKLIYDEKEGLYKMGDESKLFGQGLKGNYLTFNETEEKIYAEGKINLGVDFGKKLVIEVAGTATDEMAKDEITIDIIALLQFEFLPEATEMMLKAFEIDGFGADATRDDREIFAKAISELLPEKEASKILEDIKLSGMYKLPKTMSTGFAFTDLQLKWEQQRRAWRSTGDKIGLAAVADKQVNKRFKGHFEVIKRRSGNIVNIYIEISPREWYFYTYRQGQMEAISSDSDFNKLLIEKTKGSSPFSISSMKRKLDFVRSFQNEQ